jgi:hypothetical protein
MPATRKTAFNWTGACYACTGPSDLYKFKNRSSHSTVLLRGTVEFPDGSFRHYSPEGRRVEVCYRCRARFKRKGSFFSSAARAGQLEDQMLACRNSGMSIAAITRALKLPRRRVEAFLRTRPNTSRAVADRLKILQR